MSMVSVLPVATGNPVVDRQLSHCRFEVDAASGTIRWYRDAITGKERTPQTFAMPGTPAGDPVLQKIVYARFPSMDRSSMLQGGDRFEKLWLVDDHDHVIGRSGVMPGLHLVFPPGAMGPLTTLGVQLVDRSFDSVYAAKSAYTGAVPYWWLRSRRTAPFVIIALTLVVLVVIIALVTLL